MPLSEVLVEIERAAAAARRAEAVLAARNCPPHDLHLPMEDVKIAQRFLALAKAAVREAGGVKG